MATAGAPVSTPVVAHATHEASLAVAPPFLAALAHELRNPLSPLVNALFLLRSKVTGDTDATWALDIVDRQVGDLRALLDDTSDIARLLGGRPQRPHEPVDLAAAAEVAARAVTPALAVRRQSVRVDACGSAVVAGDAVRLTRALTALAMNAGRAARQEDVIRIAIGAGHDEATIAIHPDRENPLPSMEPGRSTERDPVASYDAGIGVALAELVAQWHGGALAIARDADGHRRFVMRLPAVASGRA